MAGDPDQPQEPGRDPGRLSPAERERLHALHLAPPGLAARPPLVAECFLFAASNPAELQTAAATHQVQAQQLLGPLPPALGRAYRALEPLWLALGFRVLGPTATLAQLLALAPAEQADQLREDLTRAGLDPDATRWPPRL